MIKPNIRARIVEDMGYDDVVVRKLPGVPLFAAHAADAEHERVIFDTAANRLGSIAQQGSSWVFKGVLYGSIRAAAKDVVGWAHERAAKKAAASAEVV